MKHFLPAVCYHPTKIIFIDDNRKFLGYIKTWLNHDEFTYRTFDNPSVALGFFTSEYHPYSFSDNCIYRPNDDEFLPFDHAEVGIDIRKIHHEIYNSNRFSEIAVIVIDYAMPGLNGMEFCTKLQELPFKKIMLTGEADERLAVNAFNEGVIDKFVRKDAADFYNLMNGAIHDMQIEYFKKLSQKTIDGLKEASTADFLIDPIFIKFYDDICNSLCPTEYYLMDQNGSFMFLDKAGNPKWLVVKSEAEMLSLTEFVKEADNVPSDVILSLTERCSIPYFYSDKEIADTTPAQWLSFMHPAKQLKGEKDTYYYAFIGNSKAHDIGNFLSFENYLKNKSDSK